MANTPQYVFLKQAASLRSYFGELCLDIPQGEMTALVFSEIEDSQVGNVRFLKGPGYNRESLKARVRSWITYLAHATCFAFRVKGRPLLFIVAQPPILPLLGYLQKKLLGRKYVVWVDDVYPDVLVRHGVSRPGSWTVRLWGRFNRVVFANAEHVFTLGPDMLETIRRYLPPKFPATVVPTWVDPDVIFPVARSENAWAKQHGLTNKFTIMYSGNFGEAHELDVLLEAARRLRTSCDLHFVLVGGGAKWQDVCSSVREQDHKNVTVLPWQPFQLLPQSLSSADVSFVSLTEQVEGVSMPSKMYYAMAAGTAILASCSEHCDLAKIVKLAGCGVIVKPGVVEDLVAAIQYLSSHPTELAQYKQNARDAASSRYSRRVNAKIVREILERIQG